MHRVQFSLPPCLQHEKDHRHQSLTMRLELQCNYKLILSVKGIKATRVTGSKTKLDSDKETQKGKKREREEEGPL